MKNFFIFMLLIFGFSLQQAMAQEDQTQEGQQKLTISGEVIDFLSQKPVDSLFVEIIENGRSIDTAKIQKWGWGTRKNIRYSFDITRPGNYQMRVVSPGFKTKYVPLNIEKMHKNERFRTQEVIFMQKEKQMDEVELDEIAVTATRLKFYTNGDTLVYDATAFQMADGSMLDALIKRLPGVEMNDGGEIYVNGKKVDELQLNGRELLDSDKELFLQNLPAYMIKNIGVHEQTPRQYVGTPMEEQVEKETVMNVKMKREYAKGWIGNLEGGIGAPMYDVDGFDPNKYIARLFMSKFSDVSRLTFFANINNLNDYSDPGEQGNFNALSQSTGLMETYKLGVSGNRYTTGDVIRYNGNGNFTYNESLNESWSNNDIFLETGDRYKRSSTVRTSYDYRANTDHRFTYNQRTKPVLNTFKNVFANARLNASYHNYKNNSTDASAELDRDVRDNWGKEWLDSLVAPESGDLLNMYAVNRTVRNQHGEGHDWNVRFNGSVNGAPQYNDRIFFGANVSYNFTDQATPSFMQSLNQFYKASANDRKLNQYNDNFRNSNDVSVGGNVNFVLDQDMAHNLQISHNYSYNNQETNNSLHLLHILDGWKYGERSLGELPSVTELERSRDLLNSSYTHSYVNNNNTGLTYSIRKRKENAGFTNFSVGMNMPINSERIDYHKRGVDTVLERTTTFLQPSINFMRNNWTRGLNVNASYNLQFNAPSLTNTVDLVDDSDPMRITHGNPDLENAINHNFNFRYRDKYKEKIQVNASLRATIQQNAVAQGFVMDATTGVRTYTPENVDGNWNLNSSAGFSMPFDKDQRNVLNTSLGYSYNHSVDLSGTGLKPVLSTVGTHNSNLSLRYDWKPVSDNIFGILGKVNYRNSTSDRVGFQTMNVYDYQYGVTAQFQIMGISFATDLTMYSRTGYTSDEMNTNELVWNARASKTFCKGKLNVIIDAFDLLHNLTNVRYSVNAQGRTETYNNVIPSYALLRLVYRFTKNKGDKGKATQNDGDNGMRGGFGPGDGGRGGNGGGQRPAGGGGFGGGRPGGGMPPMR